jgi:hypothetical protein
VDSVVDHQYLIRTMLSDALAIIFLSIVSTFISEAISWVLIYRTDDYKRLKKQIDSLTDKRKSKRKMEPAVWYE